MKKPASMCAPGMDVDAGLRVRLLGHDARQQRQAEAIELVREPVVDHREDAGVAQEHLVDAACRRIALVGGEHIAVEQPADAPARGGELVHRLLRPAASMAARRSRGWWRAL